MFMLNRLIPLLLLFDIFMCMCKVKSVKVISDTLFVTNKLKSIMSLAKIERVNGSIIS